MNYLLSTPVEFELAWGYCSDPDMTVPKRACFHVMVAFMSSPLVMMLMALSLILDPTMTGNLRIGHGWYNQQQHILILIFDPWDLEIDLHKLNIWDGGTPCPL